MITLVSGIPRSGTSLLMQVLQAGGMPLLYDPTQDIRTKPVGAEDEYHPNPNGYFEIAALPANFLEVAQGHAVKALHGGLFLFPKSNQYQSILCRRDPESILASTFKTYGKGVNNLYLDRILTYKQSMKILRKYLKNISHPVVQIFYETVLEDPEKGLSPLKHLSLPEDFNWDAAYSAVDPSLWRNKSSALGVDGSLVHFRRNLLQRSEESWQKPASALPA